MPFTISLIDLETSKPFECDAHRYSWRWSPKEWNVASITELELSNADDLRLAFSDTLFDAPGKASAYRIGVALECALRSWPHLYLEMDDLFALLIRWAALFPHGYWRVG